MSNPYLSRVLRDSPKASLTSKVGLAVSGASLGLAAANSYGNHQSNKLGNQQISLDRKRNSIEEQQRVIDEKSLRALSSIHKALVVGK